MEAIRFAQVSDTHICKSYEKSQMKEVFAKCQDPAEGLRHCLKKLEQQKLDFVLFTGDLVHEGEKEDYDYFFQIVKECLPDTKAVFALGNHDRKQAFYESMGIQEKTEPYFHAEEVKGLRIVMLDSAVEGKEAGTISRQQEEQLKEVLRTSAKKGTILAWHHPVVWNNPMFAMEVSEAFREILRESDVRAVFCGHTHENSVDFLEGIPQITADSTAFGVEVSQGNFQMVEKTGYNLCTIEKENWHLHVEQAQEKVPIASIDLEAMKKLAE